MPQDASPLCLDRLDGLAFATDRAGVIRDVGAGNWEVFAAENGAPELRAEAVIDRSLFDFIEGEQVRDHLRGVLDTIAKDPNWCWVLPFRCDAPHRERAMCQSARPIFDDRRCTGFLFQSIEQHSRQRPPMGLYDFKRLNRFAAEDEDLPVVQMCSWCQRVRYAPVTGDSWVAAEDYYANGGRTKVRLTHGICEDCLKTTADPFLAEPAPGGDQPVRAAISGPD